MPSYCTGMDGLIPSACSLHLLKRTIRRLHGICRAFIVYWSKYALCFTACSLAGLACLCHHLPHLGINLPCHCLCRRNAARLSHVGGALFACWRTRACMVAWTWCAVTDSCAVAFGVYRRIAAVRPQQHPAGRRGSWRFSVLFRLAPARHVAGLDRLAQLAASRARTYRPS